MLEGGADGARDPATCEGECSGGARASTPLLPGLIGGDSWDGAPCSAPCGKDTDEDVATVDEEVSPRRALVSSSRSTSGRREMQQMRSPMQAKMPPNAPRRMKDTGVGLVPEGAVSPLPLLVSLVLLVVVEVVVVVVVCTVGVLAVSFPDAACEAPAAKNKTK